MFCFMLGVAQQRPPLRCIRRTIPDKLITEGIPSYRIAKTCSPYTLHVHTVKQLAEPMHTSRDDSDVKLVCNSSGEHGALETKPLPC